LGNDFVSRPRLSGAHFSTRARRARTHERVSEKAATAVMHAQSLDAHHARETGVVSREPGAGRESCGDATRGGGGGGGGGGSAGGEEAMAVPAGRDGCVGE
jgi:hypothetical protein